MTVYYIGLDQYQPPLAANVSEGTSAPAADVYVAIGNNLPIANLNRGAICKRLEALLLYLRTDGQSGADVIPFGTR